MCNAPATFAVTTSSRDLTSQQLDSSGAPRRGAPWSQIIRRCDAVNRNPFLHLLLSLATFLTYGGGVMKVVLITSFLLTVINHSCFAFPEIGVATIPQKDDPTRAEREHEEPQPETLCGPTTNGVLPVIAFRIARPKDYSCSNWLAAITQRVNEKRSLQVINPLRTEPDMQKYALELTAGENAPLGKAKRLYEALVTRALPRAPQFTRPETAPNIFAAWQQPEVSLRCQDFAYLYTALARCSGLPAYVVSIEEDCYGDQTPHACTAIVITNRVLLIDLAYHLFGAPHHRFRMLDDIQVAADYMAQLGGFSNCELAHQLDPDSPLIELNLFTAELNDRRVDSAKETLARLVFLDPESPLTYQARAMMALREKNFTEALALLHNAAQLAPELDSPYAIRGDVFAEQRRWREAAEAYQQALARVFYQGKVSKLRQAIASCKAHLACDKTWSLQASRDWAAMISGFDVAIRADPGFAEAYYGRALAEQMKGDHHAAVSDYTKVVELNPGLPHGYIGLAWEHLRLGEFGSGLSNSETAVHLDPRSAEAYYARGSILQEIGNHSAALTNFDKAIELKPGFAEVFLARGVLEQLEGHLNSAAADFDRAIELNPNLTQANSNRAALKQPRETTNQK